MEQYLRRITARICNLIRHKEAARGLRTAHRLQRHDDGSYTITIRLVPEGVDVNGSGVDGVVISQHRRFGAFDR